MPGPRYSAVDVPDVGYCTRCWHPTESLAAMHDPQCAELADALLE